MKKLTFCSLAFLAMLVLFGSICEARHKHLLFRYPQPQYRPRPYTDIWGNHYRRYENLWKDSDHGGDDQLKHLAQTASPPRSHFGGGEAVLELLRSSHQDKGSPCVWIAQS